LQQQGANQVVQEVSEPHLQKEKQDGGGRDMTDYQICLTVVAAIFYLAGFLMGRAVK
jgi:hypothetical protein